MTATSIAQALKKALEAEDVKGVDIQVSVPTDQIHGDFTSNVAMMAAKKIGKNPVEVAQGLKATLSDMAIEGVREIQVIKPGFLNFWLDPEFIIGRLNVILSETKDLVSTRDSSPSVQNDNSRKVIVEYSSPNIAKPFTIGHLRSTIIGDAVANLLEAVGYEVIRDNHVGDWGTQFGKQIYAIKAWGNEETIENAENPVKELVALYVKFHEEAEKDSELEEKAREWFKKLEDGDAEARRLWQKCIDWSWKEFQKIYDELGVPSHGKFENDGHGYGESFFEDKMGGVLDELKEKKLLTDSQGAQLVMYPKEELPPLMIIKKDGATLYATRDLATDRFRKEKYGEDIKIINEVGIEQELYFRQLYKLEEMLGWFKEDQRVHLKHGHFRFKDTKMSTRKGNVIWLEDVISEAKKRAELLTAVSGDQKGEFFNIDDTEKLIQKDIAFSKGARNNDIIKIAIGALKWNDLKRSSHMDVVFDWDDILNMQGNSGPYLQYTYRRTQGILEKAGVILSETKDLVSTRDSSPSVQNDKKKHVLNPFHDDLEPEEVILLRTLIQFSSVISDAAENLAPHLLANYLFDLAQKFNNFYQKHKIIDSEQKTFRIGLATVVGETLKKGLDLLGIAIPDKM